jgi:hypothetical protein
MDRCRKLVIFIVIIANCILIYGQKDAHFYLTMNTDNKTNGNFPLTLLITNAGKDTVSIVDFNPYVFHTGWDLSSFTWELRTLSDTVPETATVIAPPFGGVLVRIKENNKTISVSEFELLNNGITVVIPPDSTFVSYIHLHNPYITYKEGYYKLYLYYGKEKVTDLVVYYPFKKRKNNK